MSQPTSRIRREGAAHAAAAAARARKAASVPVGMAGEIAPTAHDAPSAVIARSRAPAAAIAPRKDPAAGKACTDTIAATPAMVVIAAAGMVTTPSGAASGGNDPPWAIAIGVPTDHATVAAQVAAASHPPTITMAS